MAESDLFSIFLARFCINMYSQNIKLKIDICCVFCFLWIAPLCAFADMGAPTIHAVGRVVMDERIHTQTWRLRQVRTNPTLMIFRCGTMHRSSIWNPTFHISSPNNCEICGIYGHYTTPTLVFFMKWKFLTYPKRWINVPLRWANVLWNPMWIAS